MEAEEEGMAVAAAKILLSLRNRRLWRWPEWVPRPSEDPVVVLRPLEVWPKRRRSPPHALAKEKSKAATAWALAAQNLGAALEYGAGASSSGEDVPRSPQRAREKPKVKVEMMAAGSGATTSTSGVDRVRSLPLPQPRSTEKAQAAKVVARKEAMAAPSPETPLDYSAAVGSGASSSGEDGARSPAKRKAPGAGGSGGASSGDEGCSSPSKRTRADAASGDGADQGMYYRRQKKASEPNSGVFAPGVATYSSVLSLPAANRVRGWGCGSVSKDCESIYAHKVKLINFLSTLNHPTGSSVKSGTMADANMTNRSMEQTEQKESTPIIVLDSDDEDGGTAVYKQLAPEKYKQPTTSGLAGTFTTWLASKGHQVNETSHAEGDQNTQIVPYGQTAPLMNQFPLQTWQPSVQFERVILQKRPEEERIQDLAAASHAEKIAETQVFPALPKQRKRRNSDPSSQVDGDAATAPRKRERKNEPNPAAVDFPSEAYMPMEEEEKPEKESDGLEDLWKDFSLAVESTKLDTLEEVANEKEGDEKEVDNDCNHDIRVHEDLGHVCRVCGMIVRRADTIIDYQWKKASRTRSNFCESRSRDADEIDIGAIRVSEDFIVSDIAIHPRHVKQMRPHQMEGFNFLVKNLVTDKPGGAKDSAQVIISKPRRERDVVV